MKKKISKKPTPYKLVFFSVHGQPKKEKNGRREHYKGEGEGGWEKAWRERLKVRESIPKKKIGRIYFGLSVCFLLFSFNHLEKGE